MLHPYPAIIFAPHPDDEVFGCGGTIYRLRKMGVKVTVVLATGTEERLQESLNAGKILGLQDSDFRFLRLDEGDIYSYKFPASMILDLVNEEPETQIFLPFRWDGHTDHEMLYWRVTSILGADKQSRRYDVRRLLFLYEYPIWIRTTLSWDTFGPEKAFGFTESIHLTEEERNVKQKAAMQFQSQLPSLQKVRQGKFLESLIGGSYESFRPTQL